jgi:hypothetical protein
MNFKQFLAEQEIRKQVAYVAAKMLGANLGALETTNSVDDDVLDRAKEEEHTFVGSGGGPWVVRLYKTLKKTFVRVEPPRDAADSKPIYYFKKESAT